MYGKENDFIPTKEEEIQKALEGYYNSVRESRKDGVESVYKTKHNNEMNIVLETVSGQKQQVTVSPENMIDVIKDSDMSITKKNECLDKLKFATANELMGYMPQNTTINDAFIAQYEADVNKIEQAQQKKEQADKDFAPYHDLEKDYEFMRHCQQQMYGAISAQMSQEQLQTDPFCKEIGPEKINNVLRQCATEGNMNAFNEWEKNLPPHNQEMLRDFKLSVQQFIDKNDKEILNTFANNYDKFVTDYKAKEGAYVGASKECNETCKQLKEKYVTIPQDRIIYEQIIAVRDSGLLSPEDAQTLRNASPVIMKGEQYQQFLKNATQFIQQRVPPEKLAQVQLSDYQKDYMGEFFGRLPTKDTLSKLKAYNNIEKTKTEIMRTQAQENVGGKTDNSGIDKLAEREKSMEGKSPQERMAMRINELRGLGPQQKSPVRQTTIPREMMKINSNGNNNR